MRSGHRRVLDCLVIACACGLSLAAVAAVGCSRQDENTATAQAGGAQQRPEQTDAAVGDTAATESQPAAEVTTPRTRQPVQLGGQSLTELGIRYAEGAGDQKDVEVATALFGRAAQEGDPEALYRLSLTVRDGQSPGTAGDAAALLRQAAEKGHSAAMFEFAESLRQRHDPSSAADAAAWYRRAASQGHVEAMRRLGDLYSRGEGVEQSNRAAAFWLAQAERRGTRHGDLTDPADDVLVETADGKLTLTVPGGQRDLVPGSAAAPRVLQPWRGEFQLEAMVSGNFDANGEASPGGPSHGIRAASLVLWENESNLVRLDRLCALSADGARHSCELRIVADGKQTFHSARDVENKPTLLRLGRRGGRIRAEFSQDGGQNWAVFRSQPSRLADALHGGVAVVNTTPVELSVEFAGLPQPASGQ